MVVSSIEQLPTRIVEGVAGKRRSVVSQGESALLYVRIAHDVRQQTSRGALRPEAQGESSVTTEIPAPAAHDGQIS